MGQNKSDSGDGLGDGTKDIKRKPKTGWDHSYRGQSALTTQECVSCRLFNKSCLCELSWFVILIFHYDKTKTKEKEPYPKGNFPLKPIMTSINLVKYTFVSTVETFIFSVYLISPEIGNSQVPNSFIR